MPYSNYCTSTFVEIKRKCRSHDWIVGLNNRYTVSCMPVNLVPVDFGHNRITYVINIKNVISTVANNTNIYHMKVGVYAYII